MTDKSEFTNGYALLIGVGRYKDELLSVPATAQDAVDVGRTLTNPNLCAYPASQVTVLTDEKATKTGILARLENLKDQVVEEENATVIIFFSGHGWLEGEYYFLPYETVTSRSNGKFQVALDTALPNKDFMDMVRQIQARRLVILLSTPFAGGAALSPEIEHSSQLAPVPLGVLDELSQGSGRIIISSSSPKQRSWIKPGATNSIFGTHLLAGLNGHGIKAIGNKIGILDLFMYLSETVPLDAQTIGVSQDPQIKAYSLNRNFPIAMFLGGKALSPSPDAARSGIMPGKVISYTAEIRKLLREALSDQDLSDLCMDYFAAVYDQFSSGMTKSQKIQSLIDYCNRHNTFPQLLVLVEQVNPEKYLEYEHTLKRMPQQSILETDIRESTSSSALGPLPQRNKIDSIDKQDLLYNLINSPSVVFDSVVSYFSPPPGVAEHDSQPKNARELLRWAEHPDGPGLQALNRAYQLAIGKKKSSKD